MKKLIFTILLLMLVTSVSATVFTNSDGSVIVSVKDKPTGFWGWFNSLFEPMAAAGYYGSSNCLSSVCFSAYNDYYIYNCKPNSDASQCSCSWTSTKCSSSTATTFEKMIGSASTTTTTTTTTTTPTTTTSGGCSVIDSDGNNPNVKGYAQVGTSSPVYDTCKDSQTSYEAVCDTNFNSIFYNYLGCPSGQTCSDGVCGTTPTQPTVSGCTDTDVNSKYPDGNNIYTRGSVDIGGNIISDKCYSNTIAEAQCGNFPDHYNYQNCPLGYTCTNFNNVGSCIEIPCLSGEGALLPGQKYCSETGLIGCYKPTLNTCSSLAVDTCNNQGGTPYTTYENCLTHITTGEVTTQPTDESKCSNDNHQFCRTWVVGVPIGPWSFGFGSRCSDKEVDLGTPLDCPNPPFETSTAGWTCCEAKQEYRCPSEAEGGMCRESASCLADENAIKTSDCGFVDGSVTSMFSLSPKTCCIKKTNICSWEKGTLQAGNWICDGTTNVTCPLSGGQVNKILYGCGVTTSSDNKNTTTFNNGTIIVQQIINNTPTTTTIVEGTSGGSGGTTTTTTPTTTPTTTTKVLSLSLPYTEWTESPIATRLQTLCKDKTDCGNYTDLAGTGKEYYVECKAVAQIQGQLKSDVETICADKATYGKYIAIGGGALGFAGGCAVGAFAALPATATVTGVVSATGAGIVVAPAVMGVGSLIGCVVGGVTGAAITGTAGSAIGTYMVVNCQDKTVPNDVGACMAIPKGQTFGQFQWCDIASKINFIKLGDDECSSGTMNAIIYLIIIAFLFIMLKPK